VRVVLRTAGAGGCNDACRKARRLRRGRLRAPMRQARRAMGGRGGAAGCKGPCGGAAACPHSSSAYGRREPSGESASAHQPPESVSGHAAPTDSLHQLAEFRVGMQGREGGLASQLDEIRTFPSHCQSPALQRWPHRPLAARGAQTVVQLAATPSGAAFCEWLTATHPVGRQSRDCSSFAFSAAEYFGLVRRSHDKHTNWAASLYIVRSSSADETPTGQPVLMKANHGRGA
jgi:hypothetical protein